MDYIVVSLFYFIFGFEKNKKNEHSKKTYFFMYGCFVVIASRTE